MSQSSLKPDAAGLAERITALVENDIAAKGYELVRVLVTGGSAYQTLQIMAERQDGGGMAVADCAAVSRIVSAKLEADVTLADRFTLEVSSPGIDRPLMKLKDYRRFQGHVAKVELVQPLTTLKAPLRKFEGKITRIGEAEDIAFTTPAGEVQVPLSAIARAKLVITKELLDQGAAARPSTNHA